MGSTDDHDQFTELRAEVAHQSGRSERYAAWCDSARRERDEARALVLELFRRDCAVNDSYLRAVEGRPWRYDHMASATYEEAQRALISWGLVKREECVRE